MQHIDVAGLIPPVGRIPAAGPEDPHFTLSGLLDRAGSVLRTALPKRFWVETQVLSARKKPWGWLFELVDAQAENTSNGAKLTGMMRKRDLNEISNELGFELDPTVLVGTCAILRATPTFNARYQLGLQLVGLNPALGRGLLARQADLVKEALQREGIFDRQHCLERPVDVARVAIIAPAGSAGRGDVEHEVGRWQQQGILEAVWIDAVFEGPQAPTSIAAALRQTEMLAAADRIDCFLIIRGGGDRAGLAAASSEAVVRGYLAVSVPGIVGIGHAHDRSLLDDVAWHSADTPSKALAHLRTLFVRPAAAALRDWDAITASMRHALRHRLRPDLDRQHEVMLASARTLVSAEAAALDGTRMVIEFRRAGLVVELRQLRHNLDDCADALGRDAAGQPLIACRQIEGIYADVLKNGRARLGTLDDLAPRGRVAESEFIALLARSRDQLEGMLEQANTGMQQALLLAGAHLATTYASVQAFDVDALLSRGLAVVVRSDLTLVCSAADAAAEPELNLLFGDGAVAVIPRSPNPATTVH